MKNWFLKIKKALLWRHFFPALLWAALLLVIFSLEFATFPGQAIFGFITPGMIAHFFVFAIFSFLISVSLKKQYNVPFLRKNGIKVALTSGILYGTLMEFMQLYLWEARSYELQDIMLNVAGCFFGIFIFYFVYKGTVSMG